MSPPTCIVEGCTRKRAELWAVLVCVEHDLERIEAYVRRVAAQAATERTA